MALITNRHSRKADLQRNRNISTLNYISFFLSPMSKPVATVARKNSEMRNRRNLERSKREPIIIQNGSVEDKCLLIMRPNDLVETDQ